MSKLTKRNEEVIVGYLRLVKTLYPELIENIYPFILLGLNYINIFSDLLSEELQYLDYDEMEINTTLKLVREFLNGLGENYLKQFEQALADGIFDIFNISDMTKDRFDEAFCLEYIDHTVINLPTNNTIRDGITIVHEFFHLTNSQFENGTRDIITEIISCYMELRYCQFLISKGYSPLNLYKDVFERINSTYNASANLILSASLLDIYYNTGDINKRTIKSMDQHRHVYLDNQKQILSKIRDRKLDDIINCFHDDIAHLLGGVISINLIKDTKLNDTKIKYINNNMENLSILQNLNTFDFDINNCMHWLDKEAEIIKSLEGVIYEDNSCSRTDSSRQDKAKYRTRKKI